MSNKSGRITEYDSFCAFYSSIDAYYINSQTPFCSYMISFWQVLNKLKVLDLSHSKNLTKSPCFVQVPNLEILILEGCTNLVELPESIEQLKKIVLLNLEGWKNLRSLPRKISSLKSLETLNLSDCLKLKTLGNMMNSKELLTDGSSIKKLQSFSFWRVSKLSHLKSWSP